VGTPIRGDVHYALEGAGLEGYAVSVPAILRRAELAVLEDPRATAPLRIDLTRATSPADLEITLKSRGAFPKGETSERFLDCRSRVFDAILTQHHRRLDADRRTSVRAAGIVETTDLLGLSNTIDEYARAYAELASNLLVPADDGEAAWNCGGHPVPAIRAGASCSVRPTPYDFSGTSSMRPSVQGESMRGPARARGLRRGATSWLRSETKSSRSTCRWSSSIARDEATLNTGL
jgi:hypothetical protein